MQDMLEIPIDEESAYLLFDRLRHGAFDSDSELREAIVDRVKTRSIPERFKTEEGPSLWP
jgi:hypothetical protein